MNPHAKGYYFISFFKQDTRAIITFLSLSTHSLKSIKDGSDVTLTVKGRGEIGARGGTPIWNRRGCSSSRLGV